MIIPGILESEFKDIKNKVNLLENQSELIQIDVADDILVENKTFLELEKLDQLKTTAKLEIHLMVQNPHKYTIKLEKAVNYITQVEADHIHDFIVKSKDLGFHTGVSISPDTPNHSLDPYLDNIDFVQFMGVVPGAQGRPFEPKVLEKIKEFKLSHPSMKIQVDGHMNQKTIAMIKSLDVDNFVVGSDIFKDENPINKLKELSKHV